jgi:hypothetical protein
VYTADQDYSPVVKLIEGVITMESFRKNKSEAYLSSFVKMSMPQAKNGLAQVIDQGECTLCNKSVYSPGLNSVIQLHGAVGLVGDNGPRSDTGDLTKNQRAKDHPESSRWCR